MAWWLFDTLMQNFYKVTQGNNKKVPSFAMWLEGTLNQIQLQCPGRMMDLEAKHPLKDHHFHGLCKHIYDSAWYLYSTPWYLILTSHECHLEGREQEWGNPKKDEGWGHSDNWPREGTAKLGQQIAKLMATLTQTGQDSSHYSVPGSPWEDGHRWGCSGRGTPNHLNPCSGSRVLARWPQPKISPPSVGWRAQGPRAETRVTMGLAQGGRIQLVTKAQPLFNVLDARVGAILLENALPQLQL